MSITGGIKFLSRSQCLFEDGTDIEASSGNDSSNRALDRNPITYWRSVASTDSMTETLEITFVADQTFNRIFLQDHNFKAFEIEYFSSGMYNSFTNVVGINGSLSGISETTFSQDTSYYEFTEVTASKIRISIDTTQIPNQEKYLNQVIVCSELGTLQGYPEIKGLELNRQLRTEKMLSGRVLNLKSDEVFKVQLDFKDYPNSLGEDIDLLFTLQDSEESFLIWLCGGKFGTNFFRHTLRGYRLRDIYPVQLISPLKPIYSDNVYINGLNLSVQFQEASN